MRKKVLNGLLLASAVGGMLNSGISVSAENADIHIEAEATTVNMTVPGVVGMIFNENGTNTLPDNFTIRNNSAVGGIYVSGISVNANGSGWQLVNSSTDLTKVGVDTKSIKLKMGEENSLKIINPTNGSMDSTGKAEFGINEFVIPAESEKTVKFGVERGAFSSAVTNAKAFDMGISFDWVTRSAKLTTGSDFQSKIESLRTTPTTRMRLVLVNSIDESKRASSVDVSAEGNGSVIAYKDTTGSSTNSITLAFEGVLELNADSSHVFENFELVSDDNSDFSLKTVDFSKVENASYMFSNSASSYSISSIALPKATNASYMFNNSTFVQGVFDISLPSATTAEGMFKNARGLGVVSDINLPSATTANNMFEGSVIEVISDVKFSDKLKSADYMLKEAHPGGSSSSSNRLDMSDWGMSGVTQAKYMFSSFAQNGRSPFTIKMFDTSGLTDGSYLFDGMNGTVNMDLSYNNFDNLEKADYMFNGCMAFTSSKLIFENVSFPKLTSAISMFDNSVIRSGRVRNLSFPVLGKADRMFGGGMSYSAVDLSSFSFGSLVSANNMINGFMEAASMDLSNWGDMSRLEYANNMLTNLSSVKGSLGISSWNLSSLKEANNFINNAPQISDSITIRNASTVMSLGNVCLSPTSGLVINYVDDATKLIAEKLVADTANERVVLGTKVQ